MSPSAPILIAMILSLAALAPVAEPTRIHGIDLVWHWEGPDSSGEHQPDESINPASVVKLATTLWALDELGPDHRFVTRIDVRGNIDLETGVLDGDLIVRGGGDPDFHVENAQLMAQRLWDLGIRRVAGSLYVTAGFWIGWERGSEGTESNADKRAAFMARRLAKAWDPRTWSPQTLRSMRRYRDSTPGAIFVHLPIEHVGGIFEGPRLEGPFVEHRSNPLKTILKRFNDYSNNDIERLGFHLGDPAAMEQFYRDRWDDPQPRMRFETLSGLGSNRMSPRQITRLLGELKSLAAAQGLALSEVLPALDCGRNTLRNYAGLLGNLPRGSLVGKTGTLVQTDGGVIALAGSITTEHGDVNFFVGAPRNGARMNTARRAQTRWLLKHANDWAVRAAECTEEPLYSHQDASASRAPLEAVSPQ
jgi:D-alanyl-D-alanine carboxypeptidase/D-alanyl-D-alanine-endopeptidase (penicillin-binding protein 4)